MSATQFAQPPAIAGEAPGRGPRVFAVSDLHVDYPANMRWVESLPTAEHVDDALIVAGDVTHDLARLERALCALRARFAQVFFVPGNHELWLRDDGCDHSLEKFHRIAQLCHSLDVRTGAQRVNATSVNDDEANAVWIVPLQSWYVKPEEGTGSLFMPKPGEDPRLRGWADNYRVRWPDLAGFDRAADYFLALNSEALNRRYDAPVVSFSHFLPRVDLIRRSDSERERLGDGPGDEHPKFNFSRVAGCTGIDAQLRSIGAVVHVYGHQHRNRWRWVDGVLYVSNCLGYPNANGASAQGRALWQVFGDSNGWSNADRHAESLASALQ